MKPSMTPARLFKEKRIEFEGRPYHPGIKIFKKIEMTEKSQMFLTNNALILNGLVITDDCHDSSFDFAIRKF